MSKDAATGKRNTASRRKIMEAASRLFTENGYVETTTLAIAREAGVNEATIFRNFGSKKDLFQEIFTENTLGAENVLLSGLTNGENLRQDLKLMFREYLGAAVRHIPNYRLSVQQLDEVFDQEFYYSSVKLIDDQATQMRSYFSLLRSFGRVADIDYTALSEYLFSVFLIRAPQFLMNTESREKMESALDSAAEAYAEFVGTLISPGKERKAEMPETERP